MGKFKAKADQMFEQKVQYYMRHNLWDMVEQVTYEYEAHLRLVQPMCAYKWQHTDEVGYIEVCTVHDENSKHGEDKGPHRPCLAVDPYNLGDVADQLSWNVNSFFLDGDTGGSDLPEKLDDGLRGFLARNLGLSS